MKRYKLTALLFVLLASLSSCNDWLDLQPSDNVTEDDLFATGDGYRNALNGIYKQMSSTSLYGQNLSWGMLDALGGLYDFTSNGYSSEYATVANYKYSSDKMETFVDAIWSDAYNCIANCNQVLQRLEGESNISKFKHGSEEMLLIKGEVLALRALLHFDLMRLFAPSKDDGKKYLPYVTIYPCTFQEYTTVNDFKQKVIDDLLEAKKLVGDFDLAHESWMTVDLRMRNDHSNVSDGSDDLFYAFRGYRLNYYAICGLLARVYNYCGMYKEAFDESQIVIDKTGSSKYDGSFFYFTSSSDADPQGYSNVKNNKLYEDIIFTLSNQKLYDNYFTVRQDPKFYLYGATSAVDFVGDETDVRQYVLSVEDGRNVYCSKNVDAGGSATQYVQDMVPVLRASEMYLIRAEYYYRNGQEDLAIEEVSKLRKARNCANTNKMDRSKPNWFFEGVLQEARIEYVGEGQLFFYYKHFGVLPRKMKNDTYFVLPYPDSEVL